MISFAETSRIRTELKLILSKNCWYKSSFIELNKEYSIVVVVNSKAFSEKDRYMFSSTFKSVKIKLQED